MLPYFLVLFCLVAYLGSLSVKPNLGPLCDCSKLYDQGYFRFPKPQNYSHAMHNLTQSVQFYIATVQQPYLPKTSILLYHCMAGVREYKCHENFWGSKSKHYQVYALPVFSTVCLRAIKTRISPFGSLLARSTAFWSTSNHDTYSCKWLKTKVNHFKHFTVTIYNGALVGNDPFIHQSITPLYFYDQSEINQMHSLPFLCVLVIQSLMTYRLVVFVSKEIRSHLSFTFLNQFIFSLKYAELYCNHIQFSSSLKFCSSWLLFVILIRSSW